MDPDQGVTWIRFGGSDTAASPRLNFVAGDGLGMRGTMEVQATLRSLLLAAVRCPEIRQNRDEHHARTHGWHTRLDRIRHRPSLGVAGSDRMKCVFPTLHREAEARPSRCHSEVSADLPMVLHVKSRLR